MKAPLLPLFFLASTLGAAAQTKKTGASTAAAQRVAPGPPAAGRVDGIGKFRPGKTTLAIIAELEAELNTKVKVATTEDDVYQESGHHNVILELQADTVEEYNGPAAASQCPASRVFKIPRYKLLEDVELNDLKLTFLGNTLAQIQCSDPAELVDALAIKYGKGGLSLREKPIYCTLNLTGQRVGHVEQTFITAWGSPVLPANHVMSSYYDQDCKEHQLSYFYVASQALMNKLGRCEQFTRQRRVAVLHTARKKKLSGL